MPESHFEADETARCSNGGLHARLTMGSLLRPCRSRNLGQEGRYVLNGYLESLSRRRRADRTGDPLDRLTPSQMRVTLWE